MTEPYNPFGAVEESALPVDEPAADSRRNLLALGGLAAVLLAGGAYFLLAGGDDVVEDVALVPRTTQAVVAASPSPSSPPVAAKLPVVTKVPLGRNPFRALYVQPVAAPVPAPAPAPAAPVVTSTGAPTNGTPIVIVTPTPGTGTAPASSVSTVSLTKVDSTGAKPIGTFDYDGKTVTGAKGDVMAGKLLVLSLQKTASGTWYAYLKLGEGAKFEVHKGQTVVVQ